MKPAPRKLKLRGFFTPNDVMVKAAREITKQTISKNPALFEGYKVKPPVYGNDEQVGGIRAEDAAFGAFEVHGPNGLAAVVIHGGVGKPIIHVLRGNEERGRAIAEAFQTYAKYRRTPTVMVLDHQLYSAKELVEACLRPEFNKWFHEIR